MGILFWRHVSRSGVSYSWPDLPPGQWVFDRHAHLVFAGLAPRRLFELLPSVTAPLSQTRANAGRWNDVEGEAGCRPQCEVRHHLGHHARRHDQSGLQPGGERRVPGAGQPALPGVLFREAAVLHGGDGTVQHRRHRRRRQHADRGAYPTDRQSALGNEADRHGREDAFGVLEASDESPEDIAGRGEAVSRTGTSSSQSPGPPTRSGVRTMWAPLSPPPNTRAGTIARRWRCLAEIVGGAGDHRHVSVLADRRWLGVARRMGPQRNCHTATIRAGSRLEARWSTTTKTSRWTRPSTVGPVSRRHTCTARSTSIRRRRNG